jgi:hypothetical protein
MNLLAFFGSAVAGFVFLQYWILPQADSRWAANKGIEKLAKVGAIAALKSARTFLQIGALTYGAILFGLWATGWLLETGSIADYRKAIDILEELQGQIQGFKDSIAANLTLWAAFLGLGYFSYRHHRSDLEQEVRAAAESESKRLHAALEAGEWAPLPATPEMTKIEEAVKNLTAEQARTVSENAPTIGSLIRQLEHRWVELDFIRRMKHFPRRSMTFRVGTAFGRHC